MKFIQKQEKEMDRQTLTIGFKLEAGEERGTHMVVEGAANNEELLKEVAKVHKNVTYVKANYGVIFRDYENPLNPI